MMKKRILPVIMAVCMVACILSGCGQAEDTVNDVNTLVEVETSVEDNNVETSVEDNNVETSVESSDVATEIEENEAVSEGEQEVYTDDATQICSRCQRDVVCGTYEVMAKFLYSVTVALANLLMNMVTHQSADFARPKRFAVALK
ncbi:MAG: hypothetical protein IJA29_01920 [Lachnospiraceae bacterium]|nr:hypothetical protein [Lachnospiraceae bacterium]